MTRSGAKRVLRRFLLGGAVASSVLACLQPAPLVAQASAVRITSVRFEGNETFPDDSLALALDNKESECRSWVFNATLLCPLGAGFAWDERYFNRRSFPEDVLRIRAYYGERGFNEARVDTVVTRPSDREIQILYRIDEGRPVLIDEVNVVGAEGIPGADRASIPLQTGDRYNRLRVVALSDSLTRRLKDQGYPDAFVFRNSDRDLESPYEVDVTFRIDPGRPARFGPIDIQGNESLSDRVVNGLLPFREGDPYSLSQVEEGQRNLYGIEMLRSARITTPAVPDSIVPVTVNVVEGDVHRVRTGVGWSTFDCLTGEGRWSSRNFFGGARTLQVRGRLSNIAADELSTACGQAGTGDFGGVNWLVSADFLQPSALGRRVAFSASAFFERQSLQDVFVREAVGVELRLTRQVDQWTRTSVFYRPELSELSAAEVFFCTSFLACDPNDIVLLQGRNQLSPIGFEVVRDRSNDILNPTSGYSLSLEYEHASAFTASDFSFNRAHGQLSVYRDLGRGQTLAVRVGGGWVGSGTFGALGGNNDIVHPEKRFFLGGANSVRGFAQNQFGPRVLTVDVRRLVGDTARVEQVCTVDQIRSLSCDASPLEDGVYDSPRATGGSAVIEGTLEYRFRPTRGLEVALFLDAGRVWATAEEAFMSTLEWTPGIGLRYLSPVGPIRLDLGYRFQSQERLPVVTSQLRLMEPGEPEVTNEVTVGGVRYEITEQLVVLPRVPFGPEDGFRFGRLQLHFSIGQAF